MGHKILLFIFLGVFTTSTFAQPLDVTVNGHKKENISFSERSGNSFYMWVRDDDQRALKGIAKNDIAVMKHEKSVRVVSVEMLSETIEITESIVLVLDNSSSMEPDVEKMLKVLGSFLNSLGKGIEVSVVMFDENSNRLKRNAIQLKGESLNLVTLDFTTDFNKVMHFCKLNLEQYTTQKTYLWDATYYGLEFFNHVPKHMNKSIIFITDGEDVGSSFSLDDALSAYNEEIYIYSIDVNRSKLDVRSAKEISEKTKGSWHRAVSPEDLDLLFANIVNDLTGTYLVRYKWRLSDESPLLNAVFFDRNSSSVPARYHTFNNPKEALSFDESKFGSLMNEYHDVLNIIGLRLRTNPYAKITITGYNSDNKDIELSEQRAETVANYFTSIWGIDKSRMKVEKKNLPANASNPNTELGLQENRRVEITTDHPNILRAIIANDYKSKVEDESTITEKFSLNLFDFNSSEVSVKDGQILTKITSIYKENPNTKIVVVGYSDNIGKDDYNKKLSIKRAKTVYDELIAKGVTKDHITYKGYGTEHPQFTNDLPEGRFLNRTVRVYVKYPK